MIVKLERLYVLACFSPLVRLLGSDNKAILAPALRAVGNIFAGTDEHTDCALDAGAFIAICTLLKKSSEYFVLKECCWIVSNIVRGSQKHLQTVIDSRIYLVCLRLIKDPQLTCREHTCEVRALTDEVAWIFTGAILNGNEKQIECILKDGFWDVLSAFLTSTNVRILTKCLETLTFLVKMDRTRFVTSVQDDSWDRLEVLSHHNDKIVHDGAGILLRCRHLDPNLLFPLPYIEGREVDQGMENC